MLLLTERAKNFAEISITPKRILVPVDGSENSARAANVAIEYARKFEAELFVLHAIAIPAHTLALVEGNMEGLESSEMREYFALARRKAKTIVDEVVKSAEAKNVKATGIIHEYSFSVVETIVDQAAKYNVDLIVIGTRGLTGFKKLLVGSVSSGVVNHAHCSVLIVR
jgi:nucleotide-binding universal stress UspA family protein